ncbi:carbon-nitrogen hydrolase family protein [Fodinicola acaciae]|uniref:carbon-nitrogen hydrolase family protein n=1 Tax=Fodinicola acaciae TaxID=2681555 RepID=UPI0013CFB629|nr:carbon-nitrogen hydrolase family protein [Fodinicola acaciae]
MQTVPANPIRVAVAQAPAEPADLAGNARVAARLVGQAAAAEASLVVLPELFLPAYNPPALADADRTDLLSMEDPRLAPIQETARDNEIHAIVGAAVRVDGRRFIAALHFRPDGGVTDAYHKKNLIAPDESDLFSCGDSDAAITVDDWVFGLGICYDGCFPEHARKAALAGAHAYAIPTAYVHGSDHRRDLYYAARALDNTFYVLTANAVDGPEPWRLSGGSAIYDPEGRPLGRAPVTGEGMVVADLDPKILRETREAHTMLADVQLTRS